MPFRQRELQNGSEKPPPKPARAKSTLSFHVLAANPARFKLHSRHSVLHLTPFRRSELQNCSKKPPKRARAKSTLSFQVLAANPELHSTPFRSSFDAIPPERGENGCKQVPPKPAKAKSTMC
jgi:hypothetical protein